MRPTRKLGDDDLFDKARLVVAALMAKIHTIDWTPAIIAHPTSVRGLRANWWGLQGEWLARRFGRFTSNEVIRGIPGSPTNHHGVPYSFTEEFVAVYRMHPLIPDDFSFRSLGNDALLMSARSSNWVGCTCASGWARCRWPTRSTRSARRIQARSPCITTPASSRTSTAPTGRTSIWPGSTSCACVSAGCRATTSSGGCST